MVNINIIKIIIIILIIGLLAFIYTNSEQMECSKCTVTLKNSEFTQYSYNMSDLFNQSKYIKCPIYWDNNIGYVKN